MEAHPSQNKPYLLAALLGVVFGGLMTLWIMKALPKMMGNMMSRSMGEMMEKMGDGAFDPEVMCAQMMNSAAGELAT